MGVNEMTRFGFGPKEFEQLANILADCILFHKIYGGAASQIPVFFASPSRASRTCSSSKQ